MEFRVLGVVEALEDGLPFSLGGPKQRSVLAMLVLDANRVVSTDHLVDGLWGDDPPLRAAATLQVYVSNLRKVLEPDRSPRAEPTVLLTQAPGYVLAVDPAARGRGIGEMLLEAAVAEAARRGARKLTLRVLAGNAPARRLYEWAGFTVEGVLKDEFLIEGRYVDDVLMARFL